MRRFVVGDIHGWPEPLEKLLKKVKFDFEKDLLIQLGDIVDRGPNSYGVVEVLLKVKNLVLIQGNHDIWFKEYLITRYVGSDWFQQGGNKTLNSYKWRNFEKIDEHMDFYNRQVPYHILDNKIFTHGGFNPKTNVNGQDPWNFAWDRDMIMEVMNTQKGVESVDGFDEIFVGHTPTIYWSKQEETRGGLILPHSFPITTPINVGNVWNVDTGCGKKGPLTIMNIDTKEYWQEEPDYSQR